MTILTANELRGHVETDIDDVALNRLATGAEALIVSVAGVIASQTDYLEGGTQNIYTTRGVEAITSIIERDFVDDAATTLSADDYRLQAGFRLVRLREGTNARTFWAQHVEVAYTPDVDTGLIQTVQIGLVKLGVGYTGSQRERFGDVDIWHQEYRNEVQSLLMPLTNSTMRMPLR